MTMKITKTGRGSEANDESLLFEWLNHEVPESIKLSYETMLSTNKFAGSLQTNQIMGIYLEPITFSGEFFGEYISKNNNNQLEYITAKERSDQLARLQGRIIKFWFEGIKQLVIIQKYEIEILNYNHIQYTISLQPHDIQLPITPIEVKQYLTKSFIQAQTPVAPPSTITGQPVEITYYNTSVVDDFKNKQNDIALKANINKKENTKLLDQKLNEFKNNEANIKSLLKKDRNSTNENNLKKLVENRRKIKTEINTLQEKINKDLKIVEAQKKELTQTALDVAKKLNLDKKGLKF